VRKIGLLSLVIAGTLLGIGGANSARADSGQVWSLTTPFGIIYGIIGREVVDYPTARAAGTIVVSTGQRRLYYVLGGGKAVRYAIAVGMEGYAWSGTSTVTAKREWPDWTPTPGERQRFPTLPAHMAGGADNPLGARALYLGVRSTASTAPTSPGSSAAACRQAASACPTTTSSICTTAPRSAPRSSCSGDGWKFIRAALINQALTPTHDNSAHGETHSAR
jgi:hypothetical protein